MFSDILNSTSRYVRFVNDYRTKITEANPTLGPVEITKLVAENWQNLPQEQKIIYLEAASQDKRRYNDEIIKFHQDNPENNLEKPIKKKKKKSADETPLAPVLPAVVEPIASTSSNNLKKAVPLTPEKETVPTAPKTFLGIDRDISIFTDDFLEHNKLVESELKILRKNHIEMEQQNSVLERHIEQMENGCTKIEDDIITTKNKNRQMEIYLTHLRVTLASGLHSISLPGAKNGATVENIEKYMTDLANEANCQKSPTITSKARDTLSKMEMKFNI